MTFDEVLKYFVRDARPAGVYAVRANYEQQIGESLILVGRGLSDAFTILEAAPRLAWGTVVIVRDFPAPDYEGFSARMAKLHFRAWDKFGTEHCRAWVKSLDDLGYGSHQYVLIGAVLRTTGPVLELGSGHASTPILHEICRVQGRYLVTVDSDSDWVERFYDLRTGGHAIFSSGNVSGDAVLHEHDWGVVFVDHAPGETRAKAVDRVRDRATFVVVHDSEDPGYGFEPVFETFKYRRDYKRHRPWTTVLSMTKEPW